MLSKEDKETIKARREKIKQDACCEGCDAKLSMCLAERGKDLTAPPWFGCCARGMTLDIPCTHVTDPRALQDLLDEIESGRVRTVSELEEVELLDSIREYPTLRQIHRLLSDEAFDDLVRDQYEEATWD